MARNVDKIVALIVEESLEVKAQDEVAAIHSVMMDVQLQICEIMRQIKEQKRGSKTQDTKE